jgi:hypothetical protein
MGPIPSRPYKSVGGFLEGGANVGEVCRDIRPVREQLDVSGLIVNRIAAPGAAFFVLVGGEVSRRSIPMVVASRNLGH